MTVLIGMFLLGLFIAFGTWVVSWSNHVKRELVVHVYYCTNDTCAKDATTAQMNEVARIATASPLVKNVVFVSKADALRIMKQKHPEEVAALPTNPFPNALTVIPKRGEDVEKVVAALPGKPGGRDRQGRLRQADDEPRAQACPRDRDLLHHRGLTPAVGVDVADREHDSLIDLLAPS